MRCLVVCIGVVLVPLVSSGMALGGVLYTSGTYQPVSSTTPGFPILGRLASQTFLGQDYAAGWSAKFSVTDSPGWDIDQVDVYAFGPSVFGLPPAAQTVILGIATDAGGGVPSSGLLAQTTLSGIDVEQLYSASLNIHLNPGNYWLVMLPGTNGPTDFTTVGWNETSTIVVPPGTVGGTADFGATWVPNLSDPPSLPLPAFTVEGVVSPEPTSLALAGFAGIGMAAGAWRRRRQQKQQTA